MAKMGRPKSDVIKDKIVTIRMSAEEHQKLGTILRSINRR